MKYALLFTAKDTMPWKSLRLVTEAVLEIWSENTDLSSISQILSNSTVYKAQNWVLETSVRKKKCPLWFHEPSKGNEKLRISK